MTTESVLTEVFAERQKQLEKWGEQNHPDGTGGSDRVIVANMVREECDLAAQAGKLTWDLILDEELCEAFAEEAPDKLRQELLQVAAVAVAWIEAIDRRSK